MGVAVHVVAVAKVGIAVAKAGFLSPKVAKAVWRTSPPVVRFFISSAAVGGDACPAQVAFSVFLAKAIAPRLRSVVRRGKVAPVSGGAEGEVVLVVAAVAGAEVVGGVRL